MESNDAGKSEGADPSQPPASLCRAIRLKALLRLLIEFDFVPIFLFLPILVLVPVLIIPLFVLVPILVIIPVFFVPVFFGCLVLIFIGEEKLLILPRIGTGAPIQQARHCGFSLPRT